MKIAKLVQIERGELPLRVARLPEEAESKRKTRIDKIHRHTELPKS